MPTEPTSAAVDRRQLDDLVPPPWPTWRRALVVLAALVAGAAIVVLVRSGVVVPQLSHHSDWGAGVNGADPERLVAERYVPLRNEGWVPVTLEGLELPELADVTWREVEGLPATLEPGDIHEVVVRFVAHGCEVDVGGYDVFPVRARAGLAPSQVIEVDPPTSRDPTLRTTYRNEDGGEVTLPVWPDQPPSWILDTIDAVCLTPPEEFAG